MEKPLKFGSFVIETVKSKRTFAMSLDCAVLRLCSCCGDRGLVREQGKATEVPPGRIKCDSRVVIALGANHVARDVIRCCLYN